MIKEDVYKIVYKKRDYLRKGNPVNYCNLGLFNVIKNTASNLKKGYYTETYNVFRYESINVTYSP